MINIQSVSFNYLKIITFEPIINSKMHPTLFLNTHLIRPVEQTDAAGYFKLIDANRPRLEDGKCAAHI